MRQILPAGEEPNEWPTLLSDVITDRPAQHWILGFHRVQYYAERHWTLNLDLDLSAGVRQRSQMMRKHYSDHDSV